MRKGAVRAAFEERRIRQRWEWRACAKLRAARGCSSVRLFFPPLYVSLTAPFFFSSETFPAPCSPFYRILISEQRLPRVSSPAEIFHEQVLRWTLAVYRKPRAVTGRTARVSTKRMAVAGRAMRDPAQKRDPTAEQRDPRGDNADRGGGRMKVCKRKSLRKERRKACNRGAKGRSGERRY